jgi:hypothetical protein
MIHGHGFYPANIEAAMARAPARYYENITGRALMGAAESNLLELHDENDLGTARFVNARGQEILVNATEGTIRVGTPLTPGIIAVELERRENDSRYMTQRYGRYAVF